MPIEDVKKGIEDVNRAFAEYKASMDERLKKAEAGNGVAELDAKIDKINAAINAQEKELQKISAIEKAMNRPDAPGVTDQKKAEQKKAFRAFMTGGNPDEYRNALESGVGENGGFVVPEETESTIDRVAAATVAMRSLATVRSVGSSVYKKVVNLGGTTVTRGGEKVIASNSTTPSLLELQFPVFGMSTDLRATSDMIEDASIDVEAWLGEEAGLAITEGQAYDTIVGAGTSGAKGVTAYSTVANASYSNATHFGNTLGHIAAGASGAFGSNPMDKIHNLIEALKPQYRINGTFLGSSTTYNTIRQIKDGDGNYMWSPTVAAGFGPTLFGYPVAYDDNMPTIDANSLSLAFGDFRRGYVITDRRGITVLRDPYTAVPYIKFVVTARMGGGVQNFEAIKLLKFAAS